jgi:hypothetical protein
MKFNREVMLFEGDFDASFSNLVASTIPEFMTSVFVRWMQNLSQSTLDHDILFADVSSKCEQLL